MPSHDRFLTVDLYDGKDPAQVIQCLGAFSRAAHALNPTRFPTVIRPKRGGPSPTRSTAEGSSPTTLTPSRPARGFNYATPASKGSATPASQTMSPGSARMVSPTSTGSKTPDSAAGLGSSVSSWSRKADMGATAPAWNIHQYGYMGGASQGNQGVVFGAPRQITSPAAPVPSVAEKQARMRQQELEAEQESQRRQEEAEKEAQRRREEEERLVQERKAQIEAEEEQAKLEEERLVEEETHKAKQREKEDAERQRLEMEKEREELRKAREREREAVERDKEERRQYELRRREEEDHARRDADSARASSMRTVTSTASKTSTESDRIRDLERQLAEAKERERQYMQQRMDQPQRQTSAIPERGEPSYDDSFTAGDDEQPISGGATQQRLLSAGIRPLPDAPPKPAIAPKPRGTPFSRPVKPLDAPQAESQPLPPPGATADPPSNDTEPSQISSIDPAHVKRTDLSPVWSSSPTASISASRVSEETTTTSASDQASENSSRTPTQQRKKADGWGNKSLLQREMERERERQREWEEGQIAKAKATGMNSRGER